VSFIKVSDWNNLLLILLQHFVLISTPLFATYSLLPVVHDTG